ncbi:MAG TPA: hypothetical protein VH439_04280 [Gemmatimonadales bacterium]
MTLFARGRRMFTSACMATLVVAALHTIGNTISGPPDPGYASVEAAMRAYSIPLGIGMSPSMWDIFRGLVFTMSICLVAMGVLGLVVAASREATPRLLSRMAVVLALASAALTAVYWVYRVPPPLITMAIVTLLFVVSVATTSKSADARVSI